MPSIAGKYELVNTENMDPHLSAYGLSYLVRKVAGTLTPPMEIVIEGDVVKIIVVTAMMTKETVFKFGEEYEETMPGDVKLKSVTKKLNDHEILTESVGVKNGVKVSRHYVFTDEGCVLTATSEGVEKPGIRRYKRIK